MIARVLLLTLCLTPIAQGQQVVVVLLDNSGSMNNVMKSQRRVRRIDAAKRALLTVLEQVPADAQVGVLVFSTAQDDDHWVIPLGKSDDSSLKEVVHGISARGGTPLGEFMKIAADELLSHRAQIGYGDYRLLIVTDGEASDAELVEHHLPDILRRAITVDVIGVDMDTDHSLATQVDSYRRADDPTSLTRAIQQSLAESPLDEQDPDEQSDFELLAGLPDEIALVAIQTLSESDNRAIGESAGNASDDPWQDVTAPDHRPPRGEAPPNRPVTPVRPSGQGGGTGAVLVGVALILAILCGSALKFMRR